FILNFAKTDNGNDINMFSNYSEKLNKLFSSEFQDKHDCLFQKALLTFGDYLAYISGHYTFCKFENNLRAKTDNWRKVFNDSTKSSYLKQLLDEVDISNLQDSMQNIIDDFQESNNDWKSLFIKHKAIIKYCVNYQIDKQGNKINLARSSAAGWKRKAELVSYVFFKTKLESNVSIFNPFQRVWYWDTADGTPCAVIDLWNYQNKYSFEIDIRYSGIEFLLLFQDRNWQILPDEVVQKLEEIGFVKEIEKIYNLGTDTEEDANYTKSCTCKIAGDIDFDKVENKIKEIIYDF
ncbi:hypothetical protein EZS27_030691, partial [termite gut metagenome]